jgi:hypothetical protein
MADRDAFDLFAFLGALKRRDLQAYAKLSPNAKKAAHPLVIMRWLSGTSDPAQIIRLNEIANMYVFSLGTEKELLFKLLAAACTGRVNRTTWLKGPGSGSTRLAIEAIKAKYECSTREAEEHLVLLSPADVVLCAEDAGWDKEQLKKLTTELGKDDIGTGSAKKVGGKPKK